MTPSRREDDLNPPQSEPSQRERIDELIDAVKQVQDQFEKFSGRVIWFVCLIFLMSGIAIAGFAYTLKRVHSSRVESAENGCELRNKQNFGIRSALRKFNVNDSSIYLFFPIEDDCEDFAEDMIK